MVSASTRGPGGPGPARELTEAEMRAYLEQLRAVPVEGVIAELVEMVLSAVQVKLGRPDARLLADVLAAVADAIAGRVDPQLHEGIVGALARLRVAQVEAEQAAGGPAGPDDAAGGRSATAAPVPPPTPPAGAPAQGGPGPSPSGTDPRTSRLWVPGH
jgi:hypothetical protein